MDLTLDVYQPPAGVTPKRMAIIHLFGGGFFVGNKNAGYIINDAKALGARGYTNISANYRLQSRAPGRRRFTTSKPRSAGRARTPPASASTPNRIAVAGYSAGGMLSLMAAGTNGKKEFEGDVGNAGVSSDVNASIGVYPLASAQIAGGALPAGSGHAREHRRRIADVVHQRDSRRRFSFTAPRTARSRCSRASTSSPSSTASACRHADADSGRRPCVRQQRADAVEVMAASIDLFFDRLLVNPRPYPSFGGGGGGRGGRGGRGGAVEVAPGGRASSAHRSVRRAVRGCDQCGPYLSCTIGECFYARALPPLILTPFSLFRLGPRRNAFGIRRRQGRAFVSAFGGDSGVRHRAAGSA